jgi:hypothetical protein
MDAMARRTTSFVAVVFLRGACFWKNGRSMCAAALSRGWWSIHLSALLPCFACKWQPPWSITSRVAWKMCGVSSTLHERHAPAESRLTDTLDPLQMRYTLM